MLSKFIDFEFMTLLLAVKLIIETILYLYCGLQLCKINIFSVYVFSFYLSLVFHYINSCKYYI